MDADTTTIRALARRLHERADEIRDLAATLLSHATEVAWTGVAADAMRVHVTTRVGALLSAAALHDQAADALERHASAVDLAVDLAGRLAGNLADNLPDALLQNPLDALVDGAKGLLP